MPTILQTIAAILEGGKSSFKRLVSIYGNGSGEYTMTYLHDDIKVTVEVKSDEEMMKYLSRFTDSNE